MADLYEVLQVHRRAELDVIRAAYRALARKHHPDFGGDGARMVAINDAWRVLSDSEARAAYDAQLSKSHSRRSTDRMVPGTDRGVRAEPASGRSGEHRRRRYRSSTSAATPAGPSASSSTTTPTTSSGWPARPIGRRLSHEIETVLARRASQTEALRPTGTTGRRGRH